MNPNCINLQHIYSKNKCALHTPAYARQLVIGQVGYRGLYDGPIDNALEVLCQCPTFDIALSFQNLNFDCKDPGYIDMNIRDVYFAFLKIVPADKWTPAMLTTACYMITRRSLKNYVANDHKALSRFIDNPVIHKALLGLRSTNLDVDTMLKKYTRT